MKLCECYKVDELIQKYPNDSDLGREVRKLTIDGTLGETIKNTPNDSQLGNEVRIFQLKNKLK